MSDYKITAAALRRLGCLSFNVNDQNEIVFADPDLAPSQSDIDAMVALIKSEAPLNRLRAKRDRLLAQTDWWVLPDRNPTPEQLAYRQALRDITNGFDPSAPVVFPTKPE